MDQKSQFKVFCICLGVGFIGGIVYELFSWIGLPFGVKKGKNKWLCLTLDMLFWASFAILCVAASFLFEFPSFRVYMWCGYALGGVLYLKSLHRILAFLQNVCYNSCIKWKKRTKEKKNSLKNRT